MEARGQEDKTLIEAGPKMWPGPEQEFAVIDMLLDRHVCVLSWMVTCLESISHFTVAKEHKFVRAGDVATAVQEEPNYPGNSPRYKTNNITALHHCDSVIIMFIVVSCSQQQLLSGFQTVLYT